MGDRGHIYLHDGDEPGVYLYAHWHGTELPQIVQRALHDGKSRWGDVGCLNRMIFSRLIADNVLGKTGFALNTKPLDTSDGGRFVNVDHELRCVTLLGSHFEPVTYTFEEYINLVSDDVYWPVR